MNYYSLITILGDVLGESLDINTTDRTSTLESIGIDSLKLIQAIVLVEEELGFEINEHLLLMKPINTIGDFCDIIQSTAINRCEN